MPENIVFILFFSCLPENGRYLLAIEFTQFVTTKCYHKGTAPYGVDVYNLFANKEFCNMDSLLGLNSIDVSD